MSSRTSINEHRKTDPEIADMDGCGALPRRSGELVFHEEWERRAFAMAIALSNAGRFDWDTFRLNLINAINSGLHQGGTDTQRPGYYEQWLTALEQTLLDSGMITAIDRALMD